LQESVQTDILIVGGGPAGLLAGAAAASAGVNTLLIESEQKIGDPVHTSGATAVKTMLDFNIPRQYYHPINRWRVSSPLNSATFNQTEPWGCIVDVAGTYQYLAVQAERQGVKILTGVKALQPTMSNGRVIGCSAMSISGNGFNITSKILIDASGYTGDISAKAGLHPRFKRFGVGAEYELIAPDYPQDEAVLIMGNRYAPCGYAWAFPWGKQHVRLGVGILHSDSTANPKEYLQKLLTESPVFGINLANHQIVERHFGLVPADGLVDKLVGNGIMAVGDAAGQASLIVGEGIRISMWAGRLAGEIAARAVKNGHYDGAEMKSYEQVFNSKYRRDLKIGYLLNTSLARWSDARWDAGIELLKSMPPELLAQLLQSQFSSSGFTSWLAARPRLWPKVIKYGIKMIGLK
jgi:digeranylgeranylglycerophospholipid reductase